MKQSISELASLTGMDRRRITSVVADLKPESGPRGSKLYESKEALPLLYTGDNFDDKKERARLTHHQANIAALDERVKSGELVDREVVVAEVAESIANARAKFLNLPTKVSTVIVAMDDLHEVQAVLEGAVHEALGELYNQYAGNESSGDGVEAAPETEGQ